MKKRHHTPEQIIRKLAEGDRLLNQGENSPRSAGNSRSPSRPGTAGRRNTAA